MKKGYEIHDPFGIYFITSTVHQWVDVFTRRQYIDVLVDSLRYCQKEKGLEIYAWVIMTNHIHLIVRSKTGRLGDTMRDFKKFTAKSLFESIKENPQESRKNWMLWLLQKEEGVCFWEEGYHPVAIRSSKFYKIKRNYLHKNPVKVGIVEKEEEYVWSSCGDVYGVRKGPIELTDF